MNFNNKVYNKVLSLKLPHIYVQGNRVKKDQEKHFHEAFRLWILSTIDSCPSFDLDRFEIFFSEMNDHLDLVPFSESLKEGLSEIRNWEEYQTLSYPWSFLLGDLVPLLGDPCIYRAAHHCMSFLYKLPVANPSLEDEAIKSFLATEERLRQVVLPDVSHAASVIQEWFADWSVDFLPGHGPGSTADAGPNAQKKEEHLATDELFNLVPEWFKWISPDEWSRTFKRRSKMVLVPKTATSLRSICMEPATLQYWQKSVMKAFDKVFKNSSLCLHVKLDKQSVSRKWALIASSTGLYSTIDFSAASDSVLLELVEKIFPWKVLRVLIAVRSLEIELPNKEVITPIKYAPMGSSVTFHLECTIFCCACQMACERMRVEPTVEDPIYVDYGDDIICRNDILPCVLEILQEWGFVVNERKSFTRNTFRESCGIFAYKGTDITTPMIPRDYCGLSPLSSSKKKDNKKQKSNKDSETPFRAAQLEMLTSLANQFFVSDMWMARAYVLSFLKDKAILYTPFEDEFLEEEPDVSNDFLPWHLRNKRKYTMNGIWTGSRTCNGKLKRKPKTEFRPSSFNPTNSRSPLPVGTLALPGPAPRCWGSGQPDYQRAEYSYLVAKTEGYKERYNDNYRYTEWLRSAAERTGYSTITVPIGFGPRRRLRKR